MKSKIAVIGKGNVGGALGRGLERAGYEVRLVGNEPARARETATWGDVIVLAVPYPALDSVLTELGNAVNGKVVVDVINPLTADYQPALGFSTSAAEEIQRKAPGAKVVKAFNTVFAQHMDTGQANGTPLALFAAGDDAASKTQVLTLSREIGFDAIDAGPLQNARSLEALGFFNIQLGFGLRMGPGIGFTLVH
jgi:predicted dinucleotide-binding enzyme